MRGFDRELREHYRISLLMLILSIGVFFVGYAFGQANAIQTMGRTAYEILLQFGFEERVEGLVRECLVRQGFG